MRGIAVWFLGLCAMALPLAQTGCGECTPHAAYTIPHHWTPGHYEYNTYLDHFRYYRSCTHYYTDYYGRYGYHYRSYCTRESAPVYRTERSYVQPVFVPDQYVPAVVCKKQ